MAKTATTTNVSLRGNTTKKIILTAFAMMSLTMTAFAGAEIYPQGIPATSGGTEVYPSVTGVVIDCTGLGLERAQSARLVDEDGRVVYGILKQGVPEFEERLQQGMVMYSHGLPKAMSYAGTNPLVIRAVSLQRFNWDPIIRNTDAQNIAEAAKTSDFNENYRVVFAQ